jgi:hypothetical protein
MRRTLAAALALTLLLTGCATGPSQAERVAAVRQTWDTTVALARDADTRIQDLLATHPDLTLTNGEINSHNGNWSPCDDSPYNDHWDGPDESFCLYTVGYDVEPRQPTVDLLEPLVQSYVAEGWTIWRDRRGLQPSWVDVTKDGYMLRIQGASQEYLDTVKGRYPAYVQVKVMSPCALSPDNLTEWDHDDPDDFSFATQAPPDPAG